MSLFIEEPYACPPKNISLLNFNYPSITVPNLSGNVTLTRTLKNVGTPGLYTVRVKKPDGILVKVEPESLKFSKLNEEKTFKVMLKALWTIGLTVLTCLEVSHGQMVCTMLGVLLWSEGSQPNFELNEFVLASLRWNYVKKIMYCQRNKH